MARLRLVFNVCGRDGDTTLPLFWSLVDRAIVEEVGESLLRLSLGDGCCEGGLAVIYVADGALMAVSPVIKKLGGSLANSPMLTWGLLRSKAVA